MKPRTCNVCTGRLLARPAGRDRGHNCLSLGDLLATAPPAQCWATAGDKLSAELVRAVGTTSRDNPKQTQFSRLVVRVAEVVRANPELDSATRQAILDECGQKTLFVVRRYMRNLPPGSALRAFLETFQPVVAKPKPRESKDSQTVNGARKLVDAHADLPGDFLRVLELYLMASIRRLDAKRKRGHEYTEYTVYRRVLVAADFCRFLDEQGLRAWQQVMQRHLDAYCAARTRDQGGRVFPFLAYVRWTVPNAARLRRPKLKRRPALELVPSFAEQEDAVRMLLRQKVSDVVLVGLLVAVYAQPISSCVQLRLSNFRVRQGRVQACFAEEWLPLDRPIAARVVQLYPAVKGDIRAEDSLLFIRDPSHYGRKIRELCGINIKPLRLGALASIIRRGVTGRAALRSLLGVSIPTVEHIEKTMEWDLQWTVDPETVEHRNRIIRGDA